MDATEPNIRNLASAQQRERAESLLAAAHRSGITDPKELANFMGQAQHESRNFTRLEESLNYSGEGLWATFKGNSQRPPRNGLTKSEAHALTSIPDRSQRYQAIGEKIYGGSWGRENLGNTEPRDGYTFRGRGYIQLTGRDNYERQSSLTGLSLVENPELAAGQNNAEKLAVSYWQENIQTRRGASTDVTKAGSIINTGGVGGEVKGLADRQANAAAWETALGKEGYLQGVLERHPTTPTTPTTPTATTTTTPDRTPAPTPAPTPTATIEPETIAQPLRLRSELQLSPESQRLLQGSEQHIRQLAERHRLPWDAGLDNTVAAVASEARQSGLTDITHLKLSQGLIRVAQYDGQTIKEATLDARTAANTEVDQSVARMAQADQLNQATARPITPAAAERTQLGEPALAQ